MTVCLSLFVPIVPLHLHKKSHNNYIITAWNELFIRKLPSWRSPDICGRSDQRAKCLHPVQSIVPCSSGPCRHCPGHQHGGHPLTMSAERRESTLIYVLISILILYTCTRRCSSFVRLFSMSGSSRMAAGPALW